MARHRGGVPLGVGGDVVAGAGGPEVLRGEAEHGRVVPSVVRLEGSREVAVDHERVGGVVQELCERRRREPHLHPVAVGILADADQRSRLEPSFEARDLIEDARAGAGAIAERRPCVPQRRGGVACERIERIVVGTVQHDGSRAVGVTQREDLRQVAPVGVPVHVDAPHAERVEDRGQVIRDRGRTVGVRGLAQLMCARGDRVHVGADPVLEIGARDRVGGAGAPLVHQDQVVRRQQRPQHEPVVVRRIDRAVPGPALERHDRLLHGRRRIRVFEDPEVHVDRATGGDPSEQRHPDPPAAIRRVRPARPDRHARRKRRGGRDRDGRAVPPAQRAGRQQHRDRECDEEGAAHGGAG